MTAHNYESASSLIQSLSEFRFGELVVKDDVSSNTRKFLTESDVYVSLYENLVNADNVSSTPKPKKNRRQLKRL